MEPLIVGIVGVIVLFLLLALGVHLGFTLAIVAFGGLWCLSGFKAAMGQLTLVAWGETTHFVILVIPLFILMGSIVFVSDVASDL